VKLAIQGSRALKSKKKEVIAIIEKGIMQNNPEYIITSGEPEGVCRIAQEYCKRNGITTKLYHLDRKKYARGCFYNRSKSILKESMESQSRNLWKYLTVPLTQLKEN